MKIKFDDVKLEIPESWADIRLGEYEKWYLLKPETNTEMIQYVADICRMDAKLLMESPTQLFEYIYQYIQFVFDSQPEPSNRCTIGGKEYLISFSSKLTLGEYVDVETVLGSESENKLSELLAILCRPAGEKYDADNEELFEERVEMFKNLPCDKALALIGFFLYKKKESATISNHCSRVITQANQFLRDTENFVLNGDGIRRFPIWQGIRYMYLTRCLRKKLSTFSDSSFTRPTRQ